MLSPLHWPKNGGCPFVADPDIPAPETEAAWTPAADPSTLIVQEAPPWLAAAAAIASPAIEPIAIVPAYQRLSIGGAIFRLRADGTMNLDGKTVAIVPLDDTTPDRLEALARFWHGWRRPPTAADPRLTLQRRGRLRQMLRAVDGRIDRATYRDIAGALFPQHQIEAAAWAGDALRETTIRLARDGMKLVSGDYRELLRRPRKV
ncbi:DUF2285 domain-containing protein [Rhizobium leguminosarum bv. viciae]|nr:DUF2285 domain-containing protein [Rhizobium leguminosarum bv. viciae]